MNYEINNYSVDAHFASNIFRMNRSDFLPSVRAVFNEYVQKISNEKRKDDPYPGIMTELLSGDERIEEFVKYVSDISWDILSKQGYDMDQFYTDAQEMWGQYHPFSSNMEKHFHGQGSFLTGFYFLNTPPESCKMFLHDPRLGKVHNSLPVKPGAGLVNAQSQIWYEPKPGDIIFTDSGIEHSFTRNRSLTPYTFIHINVKVVPRDQQGSAIVV